MILNAILDDLSSNFGFSNPIFKSLIILIIFLFVAFIIRFVTNRYIKKLLARTKTEFDDLIFSKTKNAVFFIIIVLGLSASLVPLEFSEETSKIINNVNISLIIFGVTLFVIGFVDALLDSWIKKHAAKTSTKVDDELLPLFHKVTKFVFFILGFLIILTHWGVQVGPLIASLGIAGLAIGLALQGTLANIFGGIQVIVDKTYKIGDRIKLESGEIGKVLDIGLRSTRIVDFDNQVIIVPNSQMSNGRVLNYAQPNRSSRIALVVNVAYGSDIEKVKKVLIESAKILDKNILDDKHSIKAYFTGMGDFSLEFKLFVPILNYEDRFVNEEKLRTEVYKKLKGAKIEIPFPTTTIYMKRK